MGLFSTGPLPGILLVSREFGVHWLYRTTRNILITAYLFTAITFQYDCGATCTQMISNTELVPDSGLCCSHMTNTDLVIK